MRHLDPRLAGPASGLMFALACTTGSFAQTSSEIELDPIVVAGEAAADAPAETVAVDEGDRIALPAGRSESDKPATTATTVLTTRVTRENLDAGQVDGPRDIGRVDASIGYNAQNRSFSLRGLDGPRVRTTVDGINVPWLDDGARGVEGGPGAIAFDSLSTIDIVKGADSTVFGGGALGGVIAFRTLNPEDLLTGDKTIGGITRGSFDSSDQSFGIDQAVAARVNNTFMLLQGGYRFGHEIANQGNIGGYGSTRTRPNPLDYDQYNVLGKVRQHIGEGQVVGVTGEFFRREDNILSRTASPTTYAPGSAKTDEVTERERVSAHYELRPSADAWLDAADIVGYWQRQVLSDDFEAVRLTSPTGPYARNNDLEETSVGLTGSVMKSVEFANMMHRVSVGGEAVRRWTKQKSSGYDTCPPGPYSFFYFFTCSLLHTNQSDMPDVDGVTLAAFIEDEISVTERFRLTPGLRVDYYQEDPKSTASYRDNPTVTGGVPSSSSDAKLSPKIRGEFDVLPELTVYAQWAQAFRAPTATELYLSYGGPGTYLAIGNPDLKPETSNGFEVGIRATTGQFQWGLSGFYNRYRNFIDEESIDPASIGIDPSLYPFGVTRYINRENVEIYGGEFSARWDIWRGIHAGASMAAYVGRDIDTGEHLDTIPAAKAILNLGYAQPEWGADAYFTVAAGRGDLANEFNETPGYGVLDLTAWWSPSQVEGLMLRAGVYNVFDQVYYGTLDIGGNPSNPTQPKRFYSETGRSFAANLTYQF